MVRFYLFEIVLTIAILGLIILVLLFAGWLAGQSSGETAKEWRDYLMGQGKSSKLKSKKEDENSHE